MNFKRLDNEIDVSRLIQSLNAAYGTVVIDTETTGLNPRKDKLVDIIISTPDENVAMFPAEYASWLLRLKPSMLLVFQNFKFDLKFLHQVGVDLRPWPIRDTMLMHHLEDEDAEHGLDAYVQRRWSDDYKSVFWAEYPDYESAPLDARLEYACRDTVYTGRWYAELVGSLANLGIPASLIEHVHRLALALYETELKGIRVDTDYLTDLGVQLQLKIQDLLPKMRESALWAVECVENDLWAKQITKAFTPTGHKWKTLPKPEFNFGSPDQLCRLLYDKLELPVQMQRDKKTWKMKRTANDEALEELSGMHPVIEWVREWRGHQKVYDAFVEGTLKQLEDGRVYPTLNVNGTATGRISHSSPNLGQLPASGGVRGIYVPDEGHVLVGADYSQLEIVIAAHFSHDPRLLEILRDGKSQHDLTAGGLGIDRALAKRLNFAMQYLCGPKKVANIVGTTESTGERLWHAYWATYPGLKRFIDSVLDRLDAGEPIVNPFGRQRHFRDFKRPNWSNRAAGRFTRQDRQAFNAIIQGTGSDCTSMAFYLVAEHMEKNKWGRAFITVHDEVLIMPRIEYAAEATEFLKNTMIRVGEIAGLTLPLSVAVTEPMERWLD